MLQNIFNEYKERNKKIIFLYKLLIDNYNQINSIRNYNINNNLIINDNFDLSNSNDSCINNQFDDNECFSSKYNRLYNFYLNKNHIKTSQYCEYIITKKFCNKKEVKRCIFIGNKNILFLLNNDNNIYYIYNDLNINMHKMISYKATEFKIIDIYYLNDNIIIHDLNKNLIILKIYNNNFKKIKTINNATYVAANNFKNITKEEKKNDDKFSYKFIWNEGGKNVQLSGEFLNNWKDKLDMKKNENQGYYEAKVLLEKKVYKFKFIVDNDWKCSKDYKTIKENKCTINIIDLRNYEPEISGNFFVVEDNDNEINIKYYEILSNYSILYIHKKKVSIEYLFEDINELINKEKLKENYKEELKKIFIKPKNNYDDLLIDIDNKLLKILNNKYTKVYNKLKNKLKQDDNNKYIFNFNYIFYKFDEIKNDKNLLIEEANELKYLREFNACCYLIRKMYYHYIIINSIKHIYKFGNKGLLFMGEKYLFSNFLFHSKKFKSPALYNFLPISNINYNDYEIIYMNSSLIILNNHKEKIFYIIDYEKFSYFLLMNKYNYYSNIVINDNYLLFDVKNDNGIQYLFINLLKNLEINHHELRELFNFKIDNNYPTFLSFNNDNKILFLYEKNQICVSNYHLLKNENIKNNNIENEKDILPKVRYHSKIIKIPYQYECSPYYKNDYDYSPSSLFSDNSYFYNSSKGNEHYIEFEFDKKYFFSDIKMTFIDKYKDCIPYIISLQLFDNKKRMINERVITTQNDKLSFNIIINEKARYIKFSFLENYGGEYIIIKRIEFNNLEFGNFDEK